MPFSAAHSGARARNAILREPRYRSWAFQREPAGRCAAPAALSQSLELLLEREQLTAGVGLHRSTAEDPGGSAATAPPREAAPGGCPARESHGPAVPATMGLEVCSELKEEITDSQSWLLKGYYVFLKDKN